MVLVWPRNRFVHLGKLPLITLNEICYGIHIDMFGWNLAAPFHPSWQFRPVTTVVKLTIIKRVQCKVTEPWHPPMWWNRCLKFATDENCSWKLSMAFQGSSGGYLGCWGITSCNLLSHLPHSFGKRILLFMQDRVVRVLWQCLILLSWVWAVVDWSGWCSLGRL